MLLIFTILLTFVSFGLSVLIIGANGMSDSPSTPFQGGFVLLFCWALTALFWCGWYFGW